MSVFARLKKAREEKKGFTLVELIVVLVILAVLAAIMIPALLGWIDEAKNKQYVLEARNIYVAAQAVADEAYANSSVEVKTAADLLNYLKDTDRIERIRGMADITNLVIEELQVGAEELGTEETVAHNPYIIKGIRVTFTSQNGTPVGATMEGGSWTINEKLTGEGLSAKPSAPAFATTE